MSRSICIHGHFYQPPRENPWLEAIERQESAYPYHDWNERIDAECYSQNGMSRILDEEGWITRIVNNYSSISFNVGPTLLSWMKAHAPGTYEAILEADTQSRARFSGHGSAMAQAYNHMIMPLACARDRETQVLWGIRDFVSRFGREPEGMWLPETAVDLESLECLARHGIRFVVLSPYQAARVRPLGGKTWKNATGGKVDPSRPFLQRLRSGASIAVFFYDAPISQAVAFERLLDSGPKFTDRLLQGFSDAREGPQLVHIATDGESYGHHHRHGDMALAHALRRIEEMEGVDLTNYGEHLERYPPTHEVEIAERTSWSCAHGVGRWMENCGCSTGGHPGWSQEWRWPLREALDALRDGLAPVYERAGSEFFHDPWKARDEYIEVILDRSPAVIDGFFGRHARNPLAEADRIKALNLLEMQRHAMLMYTSCGWFFDDLSGIETVQVMQYADRALQVAAPFGTGDLEADFLGRIERARSNLPEQGSGREIFERRVRPSRITLKEVGAHYAVSSIFNEFPPEAGVYCYTVAREAQETRQSGRSRLSAGQAIIRSKITGESSHVTYGALSLGDHNVVAGVREYMGGEAYEELVKDLIEAFETADTPEVVRRIDRHFGDSSVSLRSLFRDDQDELLEVLLEDRLEDADRVYQRLYEQNAPVMKFLAMMHMTIPPPMQLAAERALNHKLRKAISGDGGDPQLAGRVLEEARERNVRLDEATLSYALESRLDQLSARLRGDPGTRETLEALHAAVDMAALLPFGVRLWTVQNVYWDLLTDVLPGLRELAAEGGRGAQEWIDSFAALGAKIRIRAS